MSGSEEPIEPRSLAAAHPAQKPGKHKLLLVDDHPLVREGIRVSLETLEHLEIVGQASDGAEAISLARRLRPDIVLMDISMPGTNGLDATRVLRQEIPEIKVLILTVHEKKEYVVEVLRAGACGYVLKDSPPEELIRAIETVLGEGQFFSPKVSRWSAPKYLRPLRRRSRKSAFGTLSHQEKTVLQMIAQGFANKEIARQMGLTFYTVLTYRKRVMRKLGINNAAGLTNFAIRNGFLADLGEGRGGG